MYKKIMQWLSKNSLWCVAAGLSLAASGLDGTYMAQWQPKSVGWLGYVLNTVADCCGMLLSYKYGRFQMDRSAVKRRRSKVLLVGEAIAIAYSWFFSWRQLRFVLPSIEPQDWQWVSWVAAGFVPLLLAFIGYTQSLQAGRFETEKTGQLEAIAEPQKADTAIPEEISEPLPAIVEEPEPIAERPKATIADWRVILPQLDGKRRQMTAQDVASELEREGYACPSLRTLSNWAKLAQQTEEVTI